MSESDAWVVRAIGTVSSARDQVLDDDWGEGEASITLLPPYDAQSVRGLDAFSHIEVVFVFDRVEDSSVHTGARHPGGNREWPEVGIFAQRAKDRPNRIGLSTCELVAVDGNRLLVRGLDAIDGTPRPRHQAVHGGVRTADGGAPACVVAGADVRVLLI